MIAIQEFRRQGLWLHVIAHRKRFSVFAISRDELVDLTAISANSHSHSRQILQQSFDQNQRHMGMLDLTILLLLLSNN